MDRSRVDRRCRARSRRLRPNCTKVAGRLLMGVVARQLRLGHADVVRKVEELDRFEEWARHARARHRVAQTEPAVDRRASRRFREPWREHDVGQVEAPTSEHVRRSRKRLQRIGDLHQRSEHQFGVAGCCHGGTTFDKSGIHQPLGDFMSERRRIAPARCDRARKNILR
jgi:hypothetical protein